jgi:hypothetical protein
LQDIEKHIIIFTAENAEYKGPFGSAISAASAVKLDSKSNKNPDKAFLIGAKASNPFDIIAYLK